MSIQVFLAPIVVRPSTVPAAIQPKPAVQTPRQESWHDFAQQERWRESVLGYLKVNWRGGTLLWRMINEIAAESLAEDRWELRENKKLILRVVGQLVRERVVLRHRKAWIALIDVGHAVIPLEQVPTSGFRRI